MAEIAVERKGGSMWWLWLLLAAAALLLLWWYLAGRRHEPAASGERVQVAGTAVGPVIFPATIYYSTNPEALIGRQVDLQDARVRSVSGGNLLWVGEGEGKQILVALDGKYNVNAGQLVNVHGEVRRYPGWDAAVSKWQADPGLRANFDAQKVYVYADRLEVLQRP